jgi:hypothetical protein
MQRLLPAVLSIFALTVAPACKGDDKGEPSKQADSKVEPSGDQQAPSTQTGPAAGEAGAAEAGPGEVAPGEAGAAEAGAAEAGAAEAGTAEPAVPEVKPEDLLAQAKNLDTDDEAAKKALEDAIAAGGAKIDAAKAANERGKSLMADGESERAAAFFQWAADTHKLLAEPVYNLATLAAYAGDLDVAKEHLAELQKRGDKKLMKKVGVDPAFAPLADDPDVRKIYEQ